MPVPMYAVIRTGGKQYRVEPGQRLEVERLRDESGASAVETVVDLAPVLVVDGAKVLATPSQLSNATVRARVVEETKGKKIRGFTYKSKSNQRRRWGHRQHYSLIEITEIAPGGAKTPAKAPAKATATKATATKAPVQKDEG